MAHVVLLGDSIFDNAAYVDGGPDVIAHLRGMLPRGWTATLAAVDGSVAADVRHQLPDIPEGRRIWSSASAATTHLGICRSSMKG